jgi:hypothetical protein
MALLSCTWTGYHDLVRRVMRPWKWWRCLSLAALLLLVRFPRKAEAWAMLVVLVFNPPWPAQASQRRMQPMAISDDPVIIVLSVGAVPLFEVTHTAACTEKADTFVWKQLQERYLKPLSLDCNGC